MPRPAALTADDVLRWGHARFRQRRRHGQPVPPWVRALEREYDRRLHVLGRTPPRGAQIAAGGPE